MLFTRGSEPDPQSGWEVLLLIAILPARCVLYVLKEGA